MAQQGGRGSICLMKYPSGWLSVFGGKTAGSWIYLLSLFLSHANHVVFPTFLAGGPPLSILSSSQAALGFAAQEVEDMRPAMWSFIIHYVNEATG